LNFSLPADIVFRKRPLSGPFSSGKLGAMIKTDKHGRPTEAIGSMGEEALYRSGLQLQTPDAIDKILHRFNKLSNKDSRIMADLVEYDELGLPK
jgi:hypothetical protein